MPQTRPVKTGWSAGALFRPHAFFCSTFIFLLHFFCSTAPVRVSQSCKQLRASLRKRDGLLFPPDLSLLNPWLRSLGFQVSCLESRFFAIILGLCTLPPFAQRTRKGWGTRPLPARGGSRSDPPGFVPSSAVSGGPHCLFGDTNPQSLIANKALIFKYFRLASPLHLSLAQRTGEPTCGGWLRSQARPKKRSWP